MASAAGSGGAAAGGGGGGGADAGCTRELLQSTTDTYFEALAAHDPASLPLADNVKFTENGKMMQLGQGGLWGTAGMVKYAHSALDTETCTSVSQSVVPDGSMDIPVGLRIKLQNQTITEIETIAVRPGDYKVGGSNFPSNTGAIMSAAETVQWEDSVPADQRNTRQEIQRWIEKYFKMFHRGVCNVTSSCRRLENGGGSFMCTLGASCAAGDPPATGGVLDPRLIVVMNSGA